MLTTQQIGTLCTTHSVCIIISATNNFETAASVVKQANAYCQNIIVLHDGSTETTILQLDQIDGITLISCNQEQGKDFALKVGIAKAMEMGFKHAITIDSNGQLNPADIPSFLEKIEDEGESMIIGVRQMEQRDKPRKSNIGLRYSNFWFWIKTGYRHDDPQSGFRLYPLEPFRTMKFITGEFEIESIVRLAWKGIPVTSVPVTAAYVPKKKVSQFCPLPTFTKTSILNITLILLALVYFRPMLYFRKLRQAGIKSLLASHNPPIKQALSVALGVFMGIIPLWGFQTVTSLVLAFILKLNKPLVILFTNISFPPLIPIIIYLSMLCGSVWMPSTAPLFSLSGEMTIARVQPFLLQYIVGSLTLAIVMAFAFGAATYAYLYIRKAKTKV